MSTAGATPQHPFIVAGVDGSPSSAAALRWSLTEAELRQVELHVVHAWTVPALRGGIGQMSPVSGSESSYRSTAETVLTAALEQALREQTSEVIITRRVIQRPPTAGLLLAAAGAELLVLGRRGTTRLSRPGSIRHGCIDQAGCPVVVVP
jgi:nucleotide-binding universal stress UspA family protein